MPIRVCGQSSIATPSAAQAPERGDDLMSFVRYVLGKPYTVAAVLILVSLLAIGEGLRMPVES